MASNFYTIAPAQDVALEAARFIAARLSTARLQDAVILVPNRRATITMRDAFRRMSDGRSLLLPRIFSLSDVGDELIGLLGQAALPLLKTIPTAMDDAQRLCLLAAQVRRFEEKRGMAISLDYTMKLAQNLADLQDECTRAGVALTQDAVHQLFPGDYAQHWKNSVEFLDIVAAHWPAIETELQQTTQASREVRILSVLAQSWRESPPDYPVFAVGSTASQPATAQLLSVIAQLPRGAVLLPGLDLRMPAHAWDDVGGGHPYYFMKQLLMMNGLSLADVQPVGSGADHCSIWLHALCSPARMVQWRQEDIAAQSFAHLRLLSCQHTEEEARCLALLMREAVENGQKRTALITPDEALMARVQAHLARYGLVANRTSAGTLAACEAGSLYLALVEALDAPESLGKLIQLLSHPLVAVGESEAWHAWRRQFERAARGVATHKPGQLPALLPVLREGAPYRAVETLVRTLFDLSRQRHSLSIWLERLRNALAPLVALAGQGAEPVNDALERLGAADLLGPISCADMGALVRRALDENWRAPQFDAHPQLFMLTPVEARLQHFDRVLLASMGDATWPGQATQGPWLNRAQQEQLGLPGVEAHAALVAHDVLMLASGGEVFLTYPQREAGTPVARSRFIERLMTLLAARGVREEMLDAAPYRAMAQALDASAAFEPAKPPQVAPRQRPAKLDVSQLDKLFSDPYSLYARYLLGLRKLEEVDAEPEMKDFGSVAHQALERLAKHWNSQGSAPQEAALQQMAADALAPFANRPAIQLFWQRRLLSALTFVNMQEARRRATPGLRVTAEQSLEVPVELEARRVVLSGRIDRIEAQDGSCRLIDYKTGSAPDEKDIREGKAVQLLAYALMLSLQGQAVEAVEYWSLPAAKRSGAITELAWDDAGRNALLAQLQAALADFMNPATKLLAEPVPNKHAFENDYAGVSRYDEWAG